MIVIIDYGLGNLGSIKNMLRKIGTDSAITSDIKLIEKAEKLILPGVGAFHSGMKHLSNLNLINVLKQRVVTEKVPILGICLGMQLFTEHSEEGHTEGLGFIRGHTVKFKFDENEKIKYSIPHMGWEFVSQIRESAILKNMYEENKFYFVHSYYVVCTESDDIILTSKYKHPFVSGFEKDNIIGVQFHPEKSHKYGMRLLKNFIENY